MNLTLAELRREIDAIDTELHDLIMRRVEIVEAISATKPTGPAALRPAREAQILRRLLARHHGALPARAIIEFWQVLLSASTCLQGPFTIAVTTETEALAKARFGASPTFHVYGSDGETIERTLAEPGMVAVLPWPGHSHDWWSGPAFREGNRLWVTSCLPLQGMAYALILTGTPFEPSSDDYSLIVTNAMQSSFDSAELIATSGASRLFRIAQYIAPDDARIDSDTCLLGGYPRPLQVSDAS